MAALLGQTDQLVGTVNTVAPRVADETALLSENVNAAVLRLVALLDQIESVLEETNALIQRVEASHIAVEGVVERTGEVVTKARTASHELREAPSAVHMPHFRRRGQTSVAPDSEEPTPPRPPVGHGKPRGLLGGGKT